MRASRGGAVCSIEPTHTHTRTQRTRQQITTIDIFTHIWAGPAERAAFETHTRQQIKLRISRHILSAAAKVFASRDVVAPAVI